VSQWILFLQQDTNDSKVKLITSFLLSYPLAGVLKRIPDSKPVYKNLFIIGLVNYYIICGLSNMSQEFLCSI
jgi:hypothetical protein